MWANLLVAVQAVTSKGRTCLSRDGHFYPIGSGRYGRLKPGKSFRCPQFSRGAATMSELLLDLWFQGVCSARVHSTDIQTVIKTKSPLDPGGNHRHIIHIKPLWPSSKGSMKDSILNYIRLSLDVCVDNLLTNGVRRSLFPYHRKQAHTDVAPSVGNQFCSDNIRCDVTIATLSISRREEYTFCPRRKMTAPGLPYPIRNCLR